MIKKKSPPTVVLLGRTNVGKSTLFNRLVGRREAIVSPIAGTTRDYKLGECWWLGYYFNLVDTAGLDVATEKSIDRAAILAAKKLATQADLILFMVDAKTGILPQDREYALLIRRLRKPVILVVNKIDNLKMMNNLAEFYELGLGEPIAVSANNGSGSGDLLDAIFKTVTKRKLGRLKESTVPEIKITMVGKPNVGKSTLVNKLAGEERSIVSELPHTTRDREEIRIPYDEDGIQAEFIFTDTAGIRKRNKVHETIEKMSVGASLDSIRRADIVLLILDAGEDITIQDKAISQEIQEHSKSLIIVVNKWDLVEDKDVHSDQKFIQYVNASLPHFSWAPIVFISGKTGFKVSRLLKLILEVNANQRKVITAAELKEFLASLVKKQAPRKTKGTKPPYIYSFRQLKTKPQVFEILTDQPENIHFSYTRFIQNELRAKFGLTGVAIKLITAKKKD
jgi:GTP-binding protein